MEELEEKCKKLPLPDHVQKIVDRELKRVQKMNPAQAEYTVSLTYLDWITALPWSSSPPVSIDLKAAREQLDKDHYGLDKVKKRIIEYLAVNKLKQDLRGPIICLVGPPGVGKVPFRLVSFNMFH